MRSQVACYILSMHSKPLDKGILALILILLCWSASSQAITAADQSIMDLGQVVHRGLGAPPRTVGQEFMHQACPQNLENQRIQVAAIFGANELDDLMTEHNIPNQCSSALGHENIPVGRFIHVGPDGKETQMGTGTTVSSGDVVVTASHFLRYSSGKSIPENRLIFRVYEGSSPQNCKEVDYPVEVVRHGSKDTSSDAGNDFAVIKLSRPLTTYEPLELPSEELMEGLRNGEEPAFLTGFAKHSSTDNGKNMSMVSCNTEPPPRGNYFRGVDNIFIHQCDSVGGMSGGSFSMLRESEVGSTYDSGKERRYSRYFVGVHKAHSNPRQNVDPDSSSEFSPTENFNMGVFLSPRMRQMIQEVAAN